MVPSQIDTASLAGKIEYFLWLKQEYLSKVEFAYYDYIYLNFRSILPKNWVSIASSSAGDI